MQTAKRAAIEFSLKWQSEHASHTDRYFAAKVDFWRDIFPANLEHQLGELKVDQYCEEVFDAGVLVPPADKNAIITFKQNLFEGNQGKQIITPALGRFYPQGFAWRGLNCYRGDFTPFRLIKMHDGLMVADTNHPLASYPIILGAKYVEKLAAIEEHGGVCNDIAELVSKSGPGMQAPYLGIDTDFFTHYPFRRNNENDDADFYQSARLVQHLDDTAIAHIESIYAALLTPGMKILDLMSSWISHLPAGLEDVQVTGLGMNEEELRNNPRLTDFIVHDLNKKPQLPFKENEFDAVICSASIEYLTRPLEVLSDIARVSKPGGQFVSTFSDRWFPGKEILPWSQMHPFERQGLVLDYYRKTKRFERLHTESIRGFPRPVDDKYSQQMALSDPVFAVWGYVK